LFFNVQDYSGVINPRRLVEAQLKIAEEQGCHIMDGHVTNVVRVTDSGKLNKNNFISSRINFTNFLLIAFALLILTLLLLHIMKWNQGRNFLQYYSTSKSIHEFSEQK